MCGISPALNSPAPSAFPLFFFILHRLEEIETFRSPGWRVTGERRTNSSGEFLNLPKAEQTNVGGLFPAPKLGGEAHGCNLPSIPGSQHPCREGCPGMGSGSPGPRLGFAASQQPVPVPESSGRGSGGLRGGLRGAPGRAPGGSELRVHPPRRGRCAGEERGFPGGALPAVRDTNTPPFATVSPPEIFRSRRNHGVSLPLPASFAAPARDRISPGLGAKKSSEGTLRRIISGR